MIVRFLLLSLATSLIVSRLSAQENEFKWFTGGAVGFSKMTVERHDHYIEDSERIQWTFSPEIGFWQKYNLQFGLSGRFSETRDDGSRSIASFAPSIFARKHLFLKDNFSVFVGLDLFFGYEEQSSIDFITNQQIGSLKTIAGGVNCNFGINWHIHERITLVGKYASFTYARGKVEKYNYGGPPNRNEHTGDFTYRHIGMQMDMLGSPFNIGLYYNFNWKKP